MTTLTDADLTSLVQDKLIPALAHEQVRLEMIDCWYRWKHDEIRLPRGATLEHKELARLSKTAWLGLVVASTAQCLFVDGYRSALDPVGDPEEVNAQLARKPDDAPLPVKDKPVLPEGPWKIWLANQMDKRQSAIHRAAIAYGYAYTTVLPGEDFTGEVMPVIRGVSPRRMIALYEDAAYDDWPKYAIEKIDSDGGEERYKVYDDTRVVTVRIKKVQVGDEKPGFEIENREVHAAGVCPVVRYYPELDLDGRTPGEVQPNIALAARINKTSYDRLLAQHFNSWKVRFIAGMEEPDTGESTAHAAMKLQQSDFLISADPDTKFGSLPETGLGGFIDAHEADVEALAAVTHTPTHELTGKMVNLSAEALAAARASQSQKVDGYKHNIGGSHTQALRLASAYLDDEKHAKDITGRVTWQDTSVRSLAQAVDAYGKAATMLHIPDQALWGLIPGVEKSDVEEWKRMAKLQDPLEQMQANLDRQAKATQLAAKGTPGDQSGTANGTAAKPKASVTAKPAG